MYVGFVLFCLTTASGAQICDYAEVVDIIAFSEEECLAQAEALDMKAFKLTPAQTRGMKDLRFLGSACVRRADA